MVKILPDWDILIPPMMLVYVSARRRPSLTANSSLGSSHACHRSVASIVGNERNHGEALVLAVSSLLDVEIDIRREIVTL